MFAVAAQCRTVGTIAMYDRAMVTNVVSLPVSYLVQNELFAARESPPTVLAPAKRNTKLIGDRSELRVALALAEAGYLVSKPFSENCRYDLVADDGDRLLRVQVKTGRLRGGFIRFSCCSSHAHRGGKDRPYFGQIDVLAVFCPPTRKTYLIPESDLVATQGHLRLAPTRNGQERLVRWAARYELA